jgi:hypothetical protein
MTPLSVLSRHWSHFTAILILVVSVFVISSLPRHAALALDEQTYFGGSGLMYVPMIVNPVSALPLCPAHIIIRNLAKPIAPPIIGIYFNGLGQFQYLHSYMLTGSTMLNVTPGLPPGAFFLGKHDTAPYLTCPVPYPVYAVSVIDGIYFLGTSLLP